jgi:RNA polymerase sigma-70 factor (ECF subfamily)
MALSFPDVLDAGAAPAVPPVSEAVSPSSATNAATFQEIYAEHVVLIWRGLRGLGVPEASLEDAVQDVFLVVHRRLGSFDGSSTVRTWLFGIALHVARNYRRREQRKGGCTSLDAAPEVADAAPGPHEDAATAEALRQVALALETLDDVKREVFVLAELEQMSAAEIAETLGINVNTVYSRLHAARRAFEAAVTRLNGGRR